MSDRSDHVFAYCSQCGAMVTPIAGIWSMCACGGNYFYFPHVALREGFEWKWSPWDRRLMSKMLIGADESVTG